MIAKMIALLLKSLELFLKKRKVNKYNNYTCEHDEHLSYQNNKKKSKNNIDNC